MRIPQLVLFVLLLSGLAVAQQSPVGNWKTIDDKSGKVEAVLTIVEVDGKLSGSIIKLFPDPNESANPMCTKCPGSKKDKPILGMTILWGFKKQGQEWQQGSILDPNSGHTYRCKLKLIHGGTKLNVRGYIGISLFGRTQVWERTD